MLEQQEVRDEVTFSCDHIVEIVPDHDVCSGHQYMHVTLKSPTVEGIVISLGRTRVIEAIKFWDRERKKSPGANICPEAYPWPEPPEGEVLM